MYKKTIGKILSLGIILALLVTAGYQVFVFSGLENLLKLSNSAFDNSNLDFGAIFSGKVKVKGQGEGRTNILLYGYNEFDGNGEGTVDSNIIISYYHNEKKVSTISFMRDIVVEPGMKLNSIYPSIIDQKKYNPTKEYLNYFTELTGLEIHYGVRVNMKAAKELVDKIGGIDVNIPNTFKDNEYPKFNDYSFKFCPERGVSDPYTCPAPIFKKGNASMKGEDALIFARSRKGVCYDESSKTWYDENCIENGDDARNLRQQLVIQAAGEKIKKDVDSRKIIFDLNYLQSVLEVVGNNVQTTLNLAETFSLMNNIKNSSNLSTMKRVSINYKNTEYKNGELLLCPAGNTSDITFCDGSIFSIKNKGAYASRLRQIISNPFNEVDNKPEIKKNN